MSDEVVDRGHVGEKKKRKGSSKPQTAIHEYESKRPPGTEEEVVPEESPVGSGSRKSSLMKTEITIGGDLNGSKGNKRDSLTPDVITEDINESRGRTNKNVENTDTKSEEDFDPYTSTNFSLKVPVIKSDAELLNELAEEKLLELKEAFLLFDLNGDGYIDDTDLRGTLISLGQDVSEDEINHMLSEVRGPMDFDAFVTLLGYKTIELDPEETLIEALSKWDYDQSGLISEERIRHDLMTWGDRFSQKEVDWALEEAPISAVKGNSMINYTKFCKILCGLRKKHKAAN